MAEQNAQLDALMELERRQMAGDPAITPEISAKIKAKLGAFRAQGEVKPIGKPVPDSAAKRYEDEVGIYGTMKNASGGFKDEYAGNTITGGLENTIQSLNSDFGSTGQRDWWAQFKATDNQIRNSLFGSALTPGEKAAYEASTISPGMDPKIVRENLTERQEIIRKAMGRRTDFLKANGYTPDAVDALAGEYLPDFSAQALVQQPPAPNDNRPLDPEGVGDIGFATRESAEANSLPQGAQDFQRDLSYALARGDLKTADDIIAYGKSYKGNDGRGFDIDPKQAADALASIQNGGTFNVNTPQFAAPDISDARGTGDDAVENAKAFGRGILNTVGIDDEVNAVADTFSGGTLRENLARERAIRDYDEDHNYLARGAGTLAGALAIPTGAPGAARAAGIEALRAGEGMASARMAARYGLSKRMALEGGGIAGAYGFGASDGDIGDRALTGVSSGLAGAVLSGALGYGGGAISTRYGGGKGGPSGGGGVSGAAERLGIPATPATTGGAVASGMQRAFGNLPGSSGAIQNAVTAETDALAAAARDTASRMGTISTPQQAGEIVARGAKVADRVQAREAGRAYDARTSMMGGENSPVTMGGTQSALARVSGDFGSNDVVADMLKHPLVKKLERADAGELTLGESTELLSEARRVLRNARKSGQPGRLIDQIKDIEGALEGDVMRAAQASDAIAGRAASDGAAAMQVKGDALYADRMQAQKQELKKALASFSDDVNTSGESVYRQMFTDMREEGGNLVRLKRQLDRLPKRARDTFAASAFDDFGKALPNQQGASGDAWSFQTFLTNWAKASPEAKRVAFGGRGVDREINDIVKYSERLRQIDKSRNFSNTTPNAISAGALGSALTALVTGNPGVAAGIVGTVGSTFAAGRAFLATPALRQWTRSALSAAVKGNASQLRVLKNRLPGLAAGNAAARGEINALYNYLTAAANDNVRSIGAAAASPEGGRNEQ